MVYFVISAFDFFMYIFLLRIFIFYALFCHFNLFFSIYFIVGLYVWKKYNLHKSNEINVIFHIILVFFLLIQFTFSLFKHCIMNTKEKKRILTQITP